MRKSTKVDYNHKVLEVKNLKKYFYVGSGKQKLTIPAVDNVSFDIYKGEVFGLVGESGCGKTTTGRTIIKLYQPTDGTVELNGERVVSGDMTYRNNIRRIKRETKEKILQFKPSQLKKVQIKNALNEEIELAQYDINLIKAKLAHEIDLVKQPISDYKTALYNLRSLYKLDVERVKYNTKQDIEAQKDLTINISLEEYETRKVIVKNTYERKEAGLKESAALSKEEIEARLLKLKEQHDTQLVELEEHYRPLIEEAEAKKISKQDIKPEVSRLKAQMKQDLNDLHVKYEADKAAIVVPNKEEIQAKIDELKAKANEEIQLIKDKIQAAKKQANEEIVSVSQTREPITEEQKAKIQEIKAEAKEIIAAERAEIRFVRQSNKSKESLEASRQMQMIFQDPISSLNPRMTVKEIVGEGLIIKGGYTKEEIDQKVAEALELVGLSPEFGARYPHEFSGGQRQRIGIARALIMNPTFIIADEPISALDVSIRAQVINLLTELRHNLGLTILFIAHDLSVVRFFCDRIAVMYYGKIVELAESEELFAHPMHPYTRSLLSSIPQPDPDYEKGRKRIDYNPRQHDYRTDKPSLREIAPGHLVYANEAEFIKLKKEYAEQSKKLNETAQQAKVAEPKAEKPKAKKTTTTKAKGKATTANKGGKK